MRRFVAFVVLVSAAAGSLAVALVSGATINGTSRADRLTGTARADAIDGREGNDSLDGAGGDDFLQGGPGRDTLAGGAGADRIAAFGDAARDMVRCGTGIDVVNADRSDTVSPDCELLSRQLSSDTTASPTAQHSTEVEPDSFAWGSTVVAAYQSGRYTDGGAAGIGFSTSSDGGSTWRSGLLPGLTQPSPGSSSARVSDPSVAYDAVHGVWLIASLGISADAFSLLVSRSTDGRSWAAPATAARGPSGSLDKEWIACDNWPTSPLRGRCYLSYLDVTARQIVTRFSTDAGVTWSAPARTSAALVRPGLEVNGAQPLPRPDGSLVVVYVTLLERAAAVTASQDILAARSDDGGVTFAAEVRVAGLLAGPVGRLRVPPLPSADVDASGRLYAVWHACVSAQDCRVERLFLSTSTDGAAWSPPAPVAPAPASSDQFLPGLVVDSAAAAGPTGPRLALVYHTVRHDCFDPATCPSVDVWLSSSRDGGLTWARPERLNAESMLFPWLANTGEGYFLGDYVSASFANGRAVPVFALAAPPARGVLREAIFALAPRATRR